MKIFAHRGVSAIYPENSKTALRACKAQPFFGVEVDLFQAGEDFFIVHDPWLSRLFGLNKKVSTMDEREVRTLQCKDGESIPNLEWLIREFAQTNLTINIEIKEVQSIERFASRLQAHCQQYQFNQDRLLISSFTHPYLQELNQLQPSWALGLLLAHHPLDVTEYLTKLPIKSLHLDIAALSAPLLQSLIDSDIEVFVYTVDEAIDIEFLFRHGVDGIFANHPIEAQKIVNKLI